MNILVVDYKAPTYDTDAGALDTFHALIYLNQIAAKVVFGSTTVYDNPPKVLKELEEYGVETFCASLKDMRQSLESFREYGFSHIFIYRPVIAVQLAPVVRELFTGAKIIFFTVDLHHLRLIREFNISGAQGVKRQAEEYKKIELSLIKYVDKTVLVSEFELNYLLREYRMEENKLVYLPLYRERVNNPAGFDDRVGIMFIGGFKHPPNVDGLQWFVSSVLPNLRLLNPSIEIDIVGSNMPSAWAEAKIPGLKFLGFVPSVGPLLATRRLTIAPLRYGAGIKGKVIQSMCAGVPIVGTGVAAEGLDNDSSGLIVCDSPEGFAAGVAALYTNRDFWIACRDKMRLYSEKFSKHNFEGAIRKILDCD